MSIITNKWQAREGGFGCAIASLTVEFDLVDAKGRKIGAVADVHRNYRRVYALGHEESTTDLGTFSYSIQSTRNGAGFGALPRWTGKFATVEEAQAAALKALDRSRKSQARKHGATVEEAKAAKAEQIAKRKAKVAAWLADYDARMAKRQAAAVAPAPVEAPVAPVVEVAPVEAPAAVEAAPVEVAPVASPECECGSLFAEVSAAGSFCALCGRPFAGGFPMAPVDTAPVVPLFSDAPVAGVTMPTAADLLAGCLEAAYPDRGAPAEWTVPEVARFRGFRDPDGALRFRRVEPAPVEAPAAPAEAPRVLEEQAPAFATRCGACGRTFSEPAAPGEDFAAPGYACGTCGRRFVAGAEDETLLETYARLVHFATCHYVDHVNGWSRFVNRYTFETFAAEARRAGLRTFEELLAHFRRLLREQLVEEDRRALVRAMSGRHYDPDANLAE